MIEEKRQVFENLSKKSSDIQRLILRNRVLKPDIYLNFPFLIIEPSALNRTTLSIKMQSDLRKLSVNSNHEMSLHGDLEVVSMIDFPVKAVEPRENTSSFVPFKRL